VSETVPKGPRARGDWVRLRHMIPALAKNRTDAELWWTLSRQREREDLDEVDSEKWVQLDIDLTFEFQERLGIGEYIGEGFRIGETDPEHPPPSWWQRPIKLDLWQETVEWNGVQLNGLAIYPANVEKDAAAIATGVGPHRRILQTTVDSRLLELAKDWKREHHAKLPAPEGIKFCRVAISATARQAQKAYTSLPADLRVKPGQRRGD
jgi:hypothetical protein